MNKMELIKKRIKELEHDKEMIEKEIQNRWYSPYTIALDKELIFFINENIEELKRQLPIFE